MTAADREARFRELVARQVSAANRAAHARERAVLALEQVALTHETHAEVVRSTAATVADARRHRQRSEELRTSAERALARISRQRPVAKRINGYSDEPGVV